MDVDLANLEDAVELLEQHLPRAAFVALDLEMTGITGAPETQVRPGDVPQVQYSKSRSVAQDYNIVQVGVCLFEEKAPGQFEARPFNVFVFPRPISERGADGRQVRVDDHFMGLSASSMLFLAVNGLDFNRWVNRGVSYVRGDREEELLKLLPPEGEEGSTNSGGGKAGGREGKDKPEPTKPDDIKLVNETMERVADMVSQGGKELKLPNVNGFIALIFHNKIAEKFPHLVVEKRTNPANEKCQDRWVVNLSEEERAERKGEQRRRIMTHIGFRRIWNLLKSHKRPVIFHNGFADLLFMYSAFEAPLPHSLEDFKASLRGFFPHIFDTKVLAHAPALAGALGTGRSSLPELAEALASKLREQEVTDVVDLDADGETPPATKAPRVTFSLAEGFTSYEAASEGSGEFHTAGYDAWQTGRIFAYFRAHLGDVKTLDFKNRIFLMFSAFQLNIEESMDHLMLDGIARHVYDIDTAALNQRGLTELLKPILEDGKRKYTIRWSDNRSLLLVIHGSEDVAKDASTRAAIEAVLDGLLAPQVEQSRLKFRRLDEHVERLYKAATVEEEREAGAAAAGGGPSAKRRRTG